VGHWKHSIHTDHVNACLLSARARFLAGLPIEGAPRHSVSKLLYAENWEDMEGFQPSVSYPIPDEAFRLWREAIAGQAFARGETYGFRYLDYYTALMTMRGCLARVPRACCFATEPAVAVQGPNW
jgi:N-acetylglucosamine malate deacetylase 1